jgi:protein-disulfide isomerase
MRLFGVLFCLFVSWAASAQENKYIDLTGIEGERLQLFNDISAERLSPCDDPETLAAAFSKEKPCLQAVSYGRILARLLRSGFSRSHIDKFLDRVYENNKKPLATINVVDRPSRGPEDAVVTIVEFADYECSFCGRLEPILQKLLKKHNKIARHYFLNFPLTELHKQADSAARAALAAKRQNKFWEMHDLLYERQEQLDPEKFPEWAKELGLDVEKFKKDMLSPEVDKELAEDIDQASKGLRLNGTPSLFFNGRAYIEAQNEEALENAILLAYAEATGDTSGFLTDPGIAVRVQKRAAQANFYFWVILGALGLLMGLISGIVLARRERSGARHSPSGLFITMALVFLGLGAVAHLVIDQLLTQQFGPGDSWISSWLLSSVAAIAIGVVLGSIIKNAAGKKS